MKKGIILGLGFVATLLIVTACGGSSDEPTDGDRDTSESVDADTGDGDTTETNDAVDAADGDTDAATDATRGDRTDYGALSLAAKTAYSSADSGVTVENAEYASTTADTPAIKVSSGGGMTLTHVKATKSAGGTASNDNSNFYGMNAGVLVSSSSSASNYSRSNAASITMTDCTVSTGAEGANGVFAFGEGAVATLDHVTIVTTADSSRGVDATYGGTVTITNSVISTKGAHCAALASDRYNQADAPKINATNVVGTTAGDGSPGIYCTGTFTVADSQLSATGSEAAAIEGLNSITLTDTSITGNKKWGVIIYQSMSGDSSVGTGRFSMTGGTLTNNDASGPLFFVCDTDAIITLKGATLVNSSDILLAASNAASAASCGIGNVNTDWGRNGGEVTFNATDQALVGDILICESSSSLSMSLTNSTLKGAINTSNVSAAVSLTLDSGSTWEVTGASYLSALTNSGTLKGSGTVTVAGTQVYP